MDPRLLSMGYNGSSSTSNPPPSQTQAPTRKNTFWTKRDNHIFLAACETVIVDGHRNRKCFTKHGWDQVIQLFNTNSGNVWTKQQLKNHWDSLRQKHKRLTELLNCSGVEYNSAMETIAASNEWWERKIKENKDYREYRDEDCREVYSYNVLFGDTFDSDKYAVTPSQMCQTGFAMFEDSGYEDFRDIHPDEEEISSSSDEGDKTGREGTSMDVSKPHSGDKRRPGSKNTSGKRSKIGGRKVSYSVDRVASASRKVADKLDRLVGPAVTPAKTILEELFAIGRLEKKMETCKFLSKRENMEILDLQADVEEKMDWVEWCCNDDMKRRL